jgi:hypothetical protein
MVSEPKKEAGKLEGEIRNAEARPNQREERPY